MTQITDEMKVAAVKAYTEVDGKCRPAAMQKALEAALPFLPIAGEGKVDTNDWVFEAIRAGYERGAMWHHENGSLELVEKASYDFADKMTAPSSPGKDGGQEVEAVNVEGSPLLEWAVDQWKSQVKHRPLVNVHRRSLDDVWRQVIRWAGGDPDKLVGPPHDELLAMESKR